MKTNYNFTGKQIVILGLARQGQALARFFVYAGAQVIVSDVRTADQLQSELAEMRDLPVKFVLGEHPVSLLDGCDLLCLSGGVPPQLPFVEEARARQIPLSNDSLLTLQLAKERGLGPIIAITGSSGKTTTTTLVGEMLHASGRRVHIGGNIGTPLLDRLETIQPNEPLVLELSSFQLELWDAELAYGDLPELGPDIAAILNVTPNHLDRHPHMADYAKAKFNLLRHLKTTSTVILGVDDPVTGAMAGTQMTPDSAASVFGVPTAWQLETALATARRYLTDNSIQIVRFSREQPLTSGARLVEGQLIYDGITICRQDEVRLRGAHNISNLLAAAAISRVAGADPGAIQAVARTFVGVPHRLEVVAEANDVTWINDSIATSPERAVAGLRCFTPHAQILVLLAGGKDKNLPWENFADEVVERVDFLIGFGQAGAMIIDMAQERAHYLRATAPSCAVVQRLDEAVDLAGRVAMGETVVLLSPGGTSYDAYKDFEARGQHFRQLVAQQIGERQMAKTQPADELADASISVV